MNLILGHTLIPVSFVIAIFAIFWRELFIYFTSTKSLILFRLKWCIDLYSTPKRNRNLEMTSDVAFAISINLSQNESSCMKIIPNHLSCICMGHVIATGCSTEIPNKWVGVQITSHTTIVCNPKGWCVYIFTYPDQLADANLNTKWADM